MEKQRLAAWLTGMICVACLAFTAGMFYGRDSGGDGYQIRTGAEVSVPEAAAVNAAAVTSAEERAAASDSPTCSEPIDLNTATLDQLIALPGIGEVLARRILDYRAECGGFASVAGLLDVDGIGEVKYMAIRDLVSVS